MSREASFYIGWKERAAPDATRFVRGVVALAWIVALAVAAAVALSQRTFEPSRFEFGVERDFEGVYQHTPVPHLRIARPGAGSGDSRWLLVAPGKHGGPADWSRHDLSRVTLRGSLVYRDGGTLVEVVPDSLRALGSGVPAAPVEQLGHVALSGEIVDSKCWLGVMNPGNSRAHRACARLCVAGGIPPLLIVRTPDAGLRQAVLVGPRGEALNDALLDLIALPVELEGELERHDDLFVLRTDPAAIRVIGR